MAGMLVALLLGGLPPAAGAQSIVEVQRIIIEEAGNSRVPPALALAVAKVESNFEPRAVSPAGAKGVMQLMPKTARDVFGVAERELWDTRRNVRLGITYLAQLYDQYGQHWDLALSHYNGGTLAGAGGLAVPHDFTRKYVADVLRWQRIYAAAVFESPPIRGGRWLDGPRFIAGPAAKPRAMPITGAAHPAGMPPGHVASVGRRMDPLEYGDWAERTQGRLFARPPGG